MAVDAAFIRTETSRAPAARGRVLMTADTVGGVWQYALELCRTLIARGHEVVLATMGGLPSHDQRNEVAAIAGLELHASAYKLVWMDDPWRDLDAAGEWLLDLAARVRPDVVHLNDLAHGDLDWRVPVLTVGHSCVLSWWEAVHREPAPPAWRAYRRRVQASLRACDLVVAPTSEMLGALQRHYGPLRATRVIPNGRRIGLTEAVAKARFVFSAGRLWDEGKNIAALGAIAPRLPWPVCVAGSNRRSGGTRVSFENLHSLGTLDATQMSRWFARAPIYAMPARYEPFGLSILEAAQAGCALVLGDIASLREVWGTAADYVPPDDQETLLRVLRRLIDDAALRERRAEGARQLATLYTPEMMAAAYARAYAELTACRTPAPMHATAAIGAHP